jgi:RimJ/RimL family protein N-acetyltransferase
VITTRQATAADHDAIWRMLEPVLRAGEVYLLPRDWSSEEALRYWFSPDHHVFVACAGDEVVGTYYLHANQRGGGAHVANCGYLTAQGRTGGGVATAMCLHSLEKARELGFRAMQFNCVVTTNERAVSLWHRLGFATVGRVPRAFEHPTLGFVDTLVMYREL